MAPDYFDQFIIAFSGLKPGEHRYDIAVDERFFERFAFSEINKGSIAVKLILEKQERMLILRFSIHGTVKATCDLCLEEFDQVVDGVQKLFVKYGDAVQQEHEDVIFIKESSGKIDVTHYIYEYINLLIPFRRVHPENEKGESGCNKDMIRRLEQYSQKTGHDPRWDALKDIQLDN